MHLNARDLEPQPDLKSVVETADDEPDGSSWRFRVIRRVSTVTEFLAVILLLSEVVLLAASVISRYFLYTPIVWVDEIASTIFIWLIMIGSVVALGRGGHMRLTAFLTVVPASYRRLVEVVGQVAVVAFLLGMVGPSFERIVEEAAYPLTITGISSLWRTGAVPVGVALLLVVSLLNLTVRARRREVVVSCMVLVAAACVAIMAKPILLWMGNYNLLVFFVGALGLCIAGGIPIAFAFGIATISYLGLMTHAPLTVIPGRIDEGASSTILLSVPLFVLLGALLEVSGMARALVEFLSSLLGHVRGGLNYVLIAAMYLVSGISGSKAADMAAIAPPLLPEMERRGGKRGELVALLAASGVMAETIPPSIALIMIGSVAGVSIGALFAAGFLPALVMAIPLAILARHHAIRSGVRIMVARAPGPAVLKAFILAAPALVLPLIIRTAVVEGVATATEVAVIGVVYTIITAIVVYRRFSLRDVYPMLVGTASLTGAILLIVGIAASMGWALTQSGFSQQVIRMVSVMPGGRFGFMFASIVAFIILGSVLEGLPALILLAPLLFPVAKALGIHDVHYAMVTIIAMGLGAFAPPLGVGFYTACAIAKVDPDDAFWPHWPYVAALLIGLGVIAGVPWFSTVFVP